MLDHGQTAGQDTATLPGAEGIYLPLAASRGTVGVLGILSDDAARRSISERLRLLETLAGLIGLAVERAELAAEAERIRLDIETERLRSSLLSAVSHDLRTPLSVITGAGSTLFDSEPVAGSRVGASWPLRSSTRGAVESAGGQPVGHDPAAGGALEVRKQWQPMEEVVGTAIGPAGPAVQRPPGDHPPARPRCRWCRWTICWSSRC